MGLDMYLYKAKKADGIPAKEIPFIENYLEYCLRPDKYKNASYKDWCGGDLDEVNLDHVPAYIDEYKVVFAKWDVNKNHPYRVLLQNIGYWRKSNQIHNWFVKNVQGGKDDCEIYVVTIEQLQKLKDACTDVLSHCTLEKGTVTNGYQYDEKGNAIPLEEDGLVIKDSDYAKKVLPSTSGFFFGSTDYDQWYFEDVKYTAKLLEEILNADDGTYHYFYRASW